LSAGAAFSHASPQDGIAPNVSNVDTGGELSSCLLNSLRWMAISNSKASRRTNRRQRAH
jgi:hypothetical protein